MRIFCVTYLANRWNPTAAVARSLIDLIRMELDLITIPIKYIIFRLQYLIKNKNKNKIYDYIIEKYNYSFIH